MKEANISESKCDLIKKDSILIFKVIMSWYVPDPRFESLSPQRLASSSFEISRIKLLVQATKFEKKILCVKCYSGELHVYTFSNNYIKVFFYGFLFVCINFQRIVWRKLRTPPCNQKKNVWCIFSLRKRVFFYICFFKYLWNSLWVIHHAKLTTMVFIEILWNIFTRYRDINW